VKLTCDDYVQFPEDGKRHELIDGEHVVTPTPNRKHQAVSANLLDVYRSVEGRYERTAQLALEQSDVLTTPLLAGLELLLVKIFED
jgi:hypothetical protein